MISCIQIINAIGAAVERKAKEEAMPKAPTPKPHGIPIRTHRLDTKTGKLEPIDKAPPHVKAARRRKRGKVTGARAAK